MSPEHLSWLNNYFKELYQTPILENNLNLEVENLSNGEAVLSAKIAEQHGNLYGYVHGGTLASIADVVMGVACTTWGKRVVTIDLNISFIKGAPIGSKLTAFGKVISNGNTIMRATAEIFNEQQELIVRSQASYFNTGDFNEKDYPQPAIS